MKKQKSKTAMWCCHKHCAESRKTGNDAKNSDNNPFKKSTNEWYSWNYGYNMNQEHFK